MLPLWRHFPPHRWWRQRGACSSGTLPAFVNQEMGSGGGLGTRKHSAPPFPIPAVVPDPLPAPPCPRMSPKSPSPWSQARATWGCWGSGLEPMAGCSGQGKERGPARQAPPSSRAPIAPPHTLPTLPELQQPPSSRGVSPREGRGTAGSHRAAPGTASKQAPCSAHPVGQARSPPTLHSPTPSPGTPSAATPAAPLPQPGLDTHGDLGHPGTPRHPGWVQPRVGADVGARADAAQMCSLPREGTARVPRVPGRGWHGPGGGGCGLHAPPCAPPNPHLPAPCLLWTPYHAPNSLTPSSALHSS